MKALRLAIIVGVLCGTSLGWNCTKAGQIRVQVPNGTTGAGTGDGPGQVVTVQGLTFECEDPSSSTPSSTTSSSSSSSNSSSNSSSKSGSKSTSSATGGNSSSTATGGKGGRATATGGAGGSVSGSGNSSVGPVSSSSGVSNAGNSSNTNTLNAAGGAGGAGGSAHQGQGQSQSTNSSASGNGDGSNDTTNNTDVAASKIPVGTAYAPSQFPTVMCFKGYGAGVQTMPVGVSLGGGKIDENCAILEAAGRARTLLAFCKVYISNKYVKKAGVTLEDCMTTPPIPPPVAQVAPTPQVIVVPAAPAPVPVAVTPAPNKVLVASCQLSYNRVSNVCKQLLDTGLLYFKENAIGEVVIVTNPLTGCIKAEKTKEYLVAIGIDPHTIRIEPFGSDDSVDVYAVQ